MKILLLLSICFFSETHLTQDKEILKITSNSTTTIFYLNDFSGINDNENLITLSNSGIVKAKKIYLNNAKATLLDKNNNWIVVDFVDARSSILSNNPYIVTNKNEIICCSEDKILVRGKIWAEVFSKVKN